MHRPLLRAVFLLTLSVLTTQALASDGVSAAVTARLCEQVKQRKKMHVDKSQPDTLWSDGAIFEMARTFPRELQELIAAPTGPQDLHLFLSRMTGKTEDGWQEATGPRSTTSQEYAAITSADGKVSVRVASAYFNYLIQRYPRAKLRTKSTLNPILFVVDGTVRAVVMGVAMPSAEAKQ